MGVARRLASTPTQRANVARCALSLGMLLALAGCESPEAEPTTERDTVDRPRPLAATKATAALHPEWEPLLDRVEGLRA